jgi:hypothetical protein
MQTVPSVHGGLSMTPGTMPETEIFAPTRNSCLTCDRRNVPHSAGPLRALRSLIERYTALSSSTTREAPTCEWHGPKTAFSGPELAI